MNFRTTIFLVVLLVILGAGLLVLSKRQPPAAPATDPGQLFAKDELSLTTVKTVTVERDGRKVVLARQDGAWVQTAPVRWPLSSWSVDRLVTDAAALRAHQRFEAGKSPETSLEKLGLAPPRAVLTYEYGTGQKRVLTLGKKQPLTNKAYLRVDREPTVCLVDVNLHEAALDAKVNDWREKSIKAPAAGSVDQVALAAPGLNLTLNRSQGDLWSLAAPLSGRADAKGIEDLISGVGSMQIDEFLSDEVSDLDRFGLAQPEITLSLRVAGAPAGTQPAAQPAVAPVVKTLRISGKVDVKGERFNAVWVDGDLVGPVFQVKGDAVKKFTPPLNDLRDRRLTVIAADNVQRARLSGKALGPEPVELVLSGSDWTFAAPGPSFKADSAQVRQLLKQVTETKAAAFQVDAKPVGQPLATVVLTPTAPGTPDTIRVYADPAAGKPHLALRNEETVAGVLGEGALAGLLQPLASLRHRVAWELEKNWTISQVVLTQSAGIKHHFVYQAPPPPPAAPPPAGTQPATQPAEPAPVPDWTLVGADKFEKAEFAKLVLSLSPLRVESWLGSDAKLEKADIVAALTLTGPDGATQTRTLSVHSKSRQGRFEGVDAPFLLPQSLVDALDAEYRNRLVLDLAEDKIDTVTYKPERGDTLTLQKSGYNYAAANSAAKIKWSEASGLFGALQGLSAQRFVAPVAGRSPVVSLTIKGKDGKTHSLDLYDVPGQPRTASLDGRWFTLTEEAFTKLTPRDLVEKD